jgi:hypothetical protein
MRGGNAVPLRIDRVETDMQLTGGPTGGGSASAGGPADETDRQLKERLRPLVLEILRDELERLRRRQGGA